MCKPVCHKSQNNTKEQMIILHCSFLGLLILFQVGYAQWWETKLVNWTKINQTTQNGFAMACANYNHSLYFIGGYNPNTFTFLNIIQKWDISNLTSQTILTETTVLPFTNNISNSDFIADNPNLITVINHILYYFAWTTINRFNLNTQTRMSDISLPFSVTSNHICFSEPKTKKKTSTN